MVRDDPAAGRVAMVTGAAGGIGRAIALGLAAAGSTVVLVGRSRDGLAGLATQIEARGAAVLRVTCDVADEASVRSAVATAIGQFGRLDVLVNCAGARQTDSALVDLPVAEWDRVLAVNLTGTMLMSKHVARHLMARRSGSIVNIASIAASMPRSHRAAYGVSKAGVRQLTKVMALELSAYGVRVNTVSPGATESPMLEASISMARQSSVDARVRGDLALFRPRIPLGRVATPEDVAAAVLFLASDAARHITGHDLRVNGGEAMG